MDKDRFKALRPWVERDLSAAAVAGELPRAFDVDEVLRRLSDVLASGHFPILAGESGVGKSAIVYELCRRQAAGSGPPEWRGKAVLQISIKARLAGLAKKDQLGKEMQALVDALIEAEQHVVPFFRDISMAYVHDLEPHLEALAVRFRGAIIAEGDTPTIARMLENTPDLERRWLTIEIVEPGFDQTSRILREYAAELAGRGTTFTAEALSSALILSDRFLSRSRQPRKSLDLLATVAALEGGIGTVTRQHVLDRFHTTFKVPRLLIDPAVAFDPEEAERFFRSRVLGQAEAARAVVHACRARDPWPATTRISVPAS